VLAVGTDGLPALPGDAQDHQRDRQAHDRIQDGGADRDGCRAGDHRQADVGVGAGVVAVGDQRSAVQAPACARADLRREDVAEEPDRAGNGQDA
jgi:hypothetical protein